MVGGRDGGRKPWERKAPISLFLPSLSKHPIGVPLPELPARCIAAVVVVAMWVWEFLRHSRAGIGPDRVSQVTAILYFKPLVTLLS